MRLDLRIVGITHAASFVRRDATKNHRGNCNKVPCGNGVLAQHNVATRDDSIKDRHLEMDRERLKSLITSLAFLMIHKLADEWQSSGLGRHTLPREIQ